MKSRAKPVTLESAWSQAFGKPLKDLQAWPKRLHASTLKFNHSIKTPAAAKALGPAKKPRRGTVQVTVLPCATFDPRYQCDPAVPVEGAGFSSAGIGRDVITGREWGE
jgi:hypothetical protein